MKKLPQGVPITLTPKAIAVAVRNCLPPMTVPVMCDGGPAVNMHEAMAYAVMTRQIRLEANCWQMKFYRQRPS